MSIMCDTNWCTYCDKQISPFSSSLYCSEGCLRSDALEHHPMLGYQYPELQDFPHSTSSTSPSLTATSSSTVSSPTLSPYMKTMSYSRLSPPPFSLGQSVSSSVDQRRPSELPTYKSSKKRVFAL
ncbi:hypothetical protein INT43_001234 [Umbelopsis isabellina]|uniref:Uncharacterized protein n=1 Tax=Mortierella isabellina TaxID=91625 RepID=A0A8H7PK94_MORIS|nr:hypothetical protein INT43_001234 [Umbelopsis isabellina]